jgi:hypothetical protein
LLITQGDGFRGWEIATDGAIVRRYRVNADEGSFFHFDIVAIRVPEPTGAVVAAVFLSLVSGRRQRGRNGTCMNP